MIEELTKVFNRLNEEREIAKNDYIRIIDHEELFDVALKHIDMMKGEMEEYYKIYEELKALDKRMEVLYQQNEHIKRHGSE